MAKEKYFLSRIMDGTRAGVNNAEGLYYDCEHVLTAWPHSVTEIAADTPVLIVHGNNDDTVAVAEAEVNAQLIKHAKLRLIENEGHLSITHRMREDLLSLLGMMTPTAC